jgi:saxitoxin biosynthesis operon SxtJ-like protein
MEKEIKQYRQFGLMVGGIFAAIGVWPLVRRGEDIRLWAVVLGTLLMVPALVLPKILGPIYRIWMILGHALGWVNTRIILGAIFFGLITPMGLVMRMAGKDSMRRNYDKTSDTYRVLRSPRPGSHMLRQF